MSQPQVKLQSFDVTGFSELSKDLWHMLTTHNSKGGPTMVWHYTVLSAMFFVVFSFLYVYTYFLWDKVLFKN